MKVVKHVCPTCNEAIEYTTMERVLLYLKRSVTGFFISIGLLFFVYLYLVGPMQVLDDITSFSMLKMYNDNSMEYRIWVSNHTTCDGADPYCFAFEVFEEMRDVKYIKNGAGHMLYDPFTTLEYGGSCRDMSTAYTLFLKSVGVTAVNECSVEYAHCVVAVYDLSEKYSNDKQYVVVDLTGPAAFLMNYSMDVWDYAEEGQIIWI